MKLYISLLISFIACLGSAQLGAFPLDTYRSSSRLAQGKWVKISVSQSGVYRISAQELRRYGLDPSKAKIYGYGGRRLSDYLTRKNYLDDLPPVPALSTEQGLTFYAYGPEKWSYSDKKWTCSNNPFSSLGYYFVGQTDDENDVKSIPQEGLEIDSREYATTFTQCVFHEKDLVSPAQSGHLLVGEDFRFTPSQIFNFTLPGYVAGSDAKAIVNFFAFTTSDSQLAFTANNKTIPATSSDIVRATLDADNNGNTAQITKTFTPTSDNLALGITFKGGGTVKGAHLDNITVNYTSSLEMDARSKVLSFNSESAALELKGATPSTHVWDVTDPQNVVEMKTAAHGENAVRWINPYTGMREYVAFNDQSSLPVPTYAGNVNNQDIHSMPVPDMVIVTTHELKSYAQEIANLHAQSQDSLLVHVIEQDAVFNEFGSGAADVTAIRKMLKMFYDRSGSDSLGHNLSYVMLMGRPTYDQRHLTKSVQAMKMQTLPIWATDLGTNYSTSYCSDDYITFLEDNSGIYGGSDVMSIAVGRITPRTLAEASYYVGKLKSYMTSPIKGEWRNQMLLVADDQDSGVHMDQTEDFCSKLGSVNSDVFLNKVYVDEFDQIGGVYEKAKEKMFRLLSNGAIWWNYIGHGARQTLSHEHQLTMTELYSLYLRKPPFFYGATCTFGVWDQDEPGGTEALVLNETGGCIGSFCPVRPAYISQNGVLTGKLGSELFKRDEQGKFRPLGEVVRQVKNAYAADGNKRRFAFLGDPAMRLAFPNSRVVLEEVDGQEVTEESQVTIPARRRALFSGRIVDGLGNPINDFDGTIDVSLFDAEYSTTTRGHQSPGNPGKCVTFEQQGNRVFATSDSVKQGRFTVTVAMPEEISNNFRPAAFNMYARSNNGLEAIGCNREIYLFGRDDSAPIDTVAPLIETFFLNHQSFQDGDVVNESPMVIASVSDDVAINLSSAGVGHLITLMLDGGKSYSDVAEYFTPTRGGGSIAYPLENLTDGEHSLTLRVWDTSGNCTTRTITFTVMKGQAPQIFDVYSDANPASIEANFYVSHNRPDAMLTVKVQIYNMGGRMEWEAEQRGRADMFLSSPVKWDLCNKAGQRVPRGIYLYRVTVLTEEDQDEDHCPTLTKRIAVTGA